MIEPQNHALSKTAVMRGCGWLKQNFIMKPQEIRIGNFVSFFNNDILKISAVFENGIHDKHYNGYEYNDIHPIPLNEKCSNDR